MPTEEKLGIIIPTKDRPKDLGRVLNSISGQDCKPERVLVVDGGSAPVRDIVDNFRGLNIEYVRVFPPSLTAQRNAGIKRILRDVSIVIFFDDDVILEEGCLRNMKRFWESAPGDVGGAGFNIVNVPPERPTILQKIFMVNSEEPGRILRSGFQSRIPFLDKTIPVQWIVGCAMAWRSSVFDEFMFDEWFSGYARYEEVDFSCRVGKKYRIFLVAAAKVRHLISLENESFSYALGKMETINRFYFVKKNPPLSPALCVWALFGIFLNNASKALLVTDRRYINRARGNLAGFASILLNRTNSAL